MPEVRYARELGWLEVFDPLDRRWIEVRAQDCPPAWRRQAFLEKQQRQGPVAERGSRPRRAKN